jgi:sarcosine oxidase subunit gamma
MAETRRPPAPGLTVSEPGGLAKLVLRADERQAPVALEAFGAALPGDVNRAEGSDEARSLRLGPDDYLLVLPDGRKAAAVERLAQALAERHHALVDVSARLVALELAGPAVRDALAAACPLDLHPRAFGPGQATRTLFGKAEVILDCLAPLRLRLLVNRSFLPYVLHLLAEVGREFRTAEPTARSG